MKKPWIPMTDLMLHSEIYLLNIPPPPSSLTMSAVRSRSPGFENHHCLIIILVQNKKSNKANNKQHLQKVVMYNTYIQAHCRS